MLNTSSAIAHLLELSVIDVAKDSNLGIQLCALSRHLQVLIRPHDNVVSTLSSSDEASSRPIDKASKTFPIAREPSPTDTDRTKTRKRPTQSVSLTRLTTNGEVHGRTAVSEGLDCMHPHTSKRLKLSKHDDRRSNWEEVFDSILKTAETFTTSDQTGFANATQRVSDSYLEMVPIHGIVQHIREDERASSGFVRSRTGAQMFCGFMDWVLDQLLCMEPKKFAETYKVDPIRLGLCRSVYNTIESAIAGFGGSEFAGFADLSWKDWGRIHRLNKEARRALYEKCVENQVINDTARRLRLAHWHGRSLSKLLAARLYTPEKRIELSQSIQKIVDEANFMATFDPQSVHLREATDDAGSVLNNMVDWVTLDPQSVPLREANDVSAVFDGMLDLVNFDPHSVRLREASDDVGSVFNNMVGLPNLDPQQRTLCEPSNNNARGFEASSSYLSNMRNRNDVVASGYDNHAMYPIINNATTGLQDFCASSSNALTSVSVTSDNSWPTTDTHSYGAGKANHIQWDLHLIA